MIAAITIISLLLNTIYTLYIEKRSSPVLTTEEHALLHAYRVAIGKGYKVEMYAVSKRIPAPKVIEPDPHGTPVQTVVPLV